MVDYDETKKNIQEVTNSNFLICLFYFFSILNLLVILISIIRRNFFLVWVIIEINLISFIGIVLYSESNKKQGRFGGVIYFSVNIVTSIIILALFLVRGNSFLSLNLMEIYLLVKLAVAPYYYYILSISGRIRIFIIY